MEGRSDRNFRPFTMYMYSVLYAQSTVKRTEYMGWNTWFTVLDKSIYQLICTPYSEKEVHVARDRLQGRINLL